MSAGSRWVLRYSLALVAVGAAFLLRQAPTWLIGPGLPSYITYYPAVMLVALTGGIVPGVLATAAAALAVDLATGAAGTIRGRESRRCVRAGFLRRHGRDHERGRRTEPRTRGRFEELVAARTATLDQAKCSSSRRSTSAGGSKKRLRELNAEPEQGVATQTSEILQANESLEQRIAARMAELQAANESLRASRVAAPQSHAGCNRCPAESGRDGTVPWRERAADADGAEREPILRVPMGADHRPRAAFRQLRSSAWGGSRCVAT